MLIVGILGWWYGTGWAERVKMLGRRLAATFDFFSIDLLVKTLFSPYRQISAAKIQGSLSVQMHAFFDQLISRVIGAVVRLVMITIGSLALFLYTIFGVVFLAVWGLLPLFPIVGIVLFSLGWVPWKL